MDRDGDLYAALRDCYEALSLDPYYMKAHFRLARCLHELAWSQEAYDCLLLFKHRFPDYAKSYTFETLERDIKAAIFSQTDGIFHLFVQFVAMTVYFFPVKWCDFFPFSFIFFSENEV